MAWLPGACNTPFLRMNKCVVPGLGRVRLPSEGKGHTFESCRVRQFVFVCSAMRVPTPNCNSVSFTPSKQSKTKVGVRFAPILLQKSIEACGEP